MSLNFLTDWMTGRADQGIDFTSHGGRAVPFPAPQMVEVLESRTLMSAASAAAAHAGAVHDDDHGVNLNALREQLRKANVNVGQIASAAVQPLSQNLSLDGATGDLVGTANVALRLADGSVRNLPLTVTLDPAGEAAAGSADSPAAVGDVPVLHLMLGPIDLNLLGLRVQTSPICLNITANPAGGILGQLLAGLAGPGGLLGNITGNLTQITDVVNNLLSGLNLNLGLTGVTQQAGQLVGNFTVGLSSGSASTSQAVSSPLDFTPAAAPACTILNLNLGPINLSLLGLNVKLDNCANGPINVKITAVPGPGNLLGNLLCGVAGALDGGTPLTRLVNTVNRLLDKLDRFLGDNTAAV